jgi:hypothetical protein
MQGRDVTSLGSVGGVNFRNPKGPEFSWRTRHVTSRGELGGQTSGTR